MKYKVITSDGVEEVFDTKDEAGIALGKKRKGLSKMKVPTGINRSVSIHECHNDDGGKCINWERF
ncbi:hypothetical protein LCGC14_2957970, partial [marine sediment metagenome]